MPSMLLAAFRGAFHRIFIRRDAVWKSGPTAVPLYARVRPSVHHIGVLFFGEMHLNDIPSLEYISYLWMMKE